MSADDRTQNLIASLYQEQVRIANIIADLHYDARLEDQEVEHELKRSAGRICSLDATQHRLLLSGVTR